MSIRPRGGRLAAGVVLVLAAAACSKTLDTDGLEGQLQAKIEAETDSTITSVDCPGDVKVEAGGTFECTAQEGSGATFTIEVTQTNDQGDVSWTVTDANLAGAS